MWSNTWGRMASCAAVANRRGYYIALAIYALLGAAGLLAQDSAIPPGSVNINLPGNSPLRLISSTTGDSRATARGAALSLDLPMALTLQNASHGRIHGVTLRLVVQAVTMGGNGSVP